MNAPHSPSGTTPCGGGARERRWGSAGGPRPRCGTGETPPLGRRPCARDQKAPLPVTDARLGLVVLLKRLAVQRAAVDGPRRQPPPAGALLLPVVLGPYVVTRGLPAEILPQAALVGPLRGRGRRSVEPDRRGAGDRHRRGRACLPCLVPCLFPWCSARPRRQIDLASRRRPLYHLQKIYECSGRTWGGYTERSCWSLACKSSAAPPQPPRAVRRSNPGDVLSPSRASSRGAYIPICRVRGSGPTHARTHVRARGARAHTTRATHTYIQDCGGTHTRRVGSGVRA
jgi:hypothetical protein